MKKIFKLFNSSFRGPVLFWSASMIANMFNWIFNLQAGRTLPKEDFAVLAVFLSFQYLVTVPANALSTTVARFTAFYGEKGEGEKHFFFFRQYWWLSWGLGLACFFGLILLRNPIGAFFGLDSSFLMLIFAPILIPLFLVFFERGALSGQLAFAWVGVLMIAEALTKLGFFIFGLDLPFSPLTIAVLSLPLSVLVAWFVSLLVARSFHPLPTASFSSSKNREIQESYSFLSNSFFAGLGVVLIYSLDVLLVKHYFSPYEAGVFSTLSLLGKMLYFGAGSLIGLLIPLTARAQAKNLSGRKAFLTLLSIVALAGGAIWLSYFLFPKFVVKLLLTERGLITLPYLTNYSLAMFFLVLSVCFSSFNLAKKNYLPSHLIIFAAILETLLIAIFHSSLDQVVNIILSTMFTLFASVVLIDLFGLTPKAIGTNIRSLVDLFLPNTYLKPSKKKRVLIFNWRDLKHVHAGGAEVYIHEIARNLSRNGYSITLFTSNDGNCSRYEKIDDVQIIRRGGFITVYLWALLYYLFKLRGKFNLIVDSENGIPFFSPLFAKIPVVLLVHHVHQDIFFKSLVPPFSWIANFLETFLMPLVYKSSKVVAVSDSTAQQLSKELGLNPVAVIQSGVDTKLYRESKKSSSPLISYLGRIKKYKSIEVLLTAFKKIAQELPKSQLIIAGDGDYRSFLEKIAFELKLSSQVKFLGKVSQREKIKLLGRSWVMVQPSYQEGWGITVLEANACKTPVLASNVAGLKDAVSEGESGYLFEYGNDELLYEKMKDLILNSKKRLALSKSARVWSENFDWKIQSGKFDLLIEAILESKAALALSI